ncbi:MAG: hypothetical protein K2H09_03550 [Treponemataceae bacterium]|nr:hypothetical protein [Treponemataceae bacterium]
MTRTRRSASAAILCLCICAFFPPHLRAEEVVDNDFGYALDLPEGFAVAEYTEDGMAYRFRHERFPMSFILRLYADGSYDGAESALAGTLGRLSASCDMDRLVWQDAECAVASFEMILPDASAPSRGWGAGIVLPESGAPLVLLCYADSESAEQYEPVVISALNSLAVGRGGFRSPGIMTSYAFPGAGAWTVELFPAGRRVETQIDAEDAAAAQFVVACEFSVLRLYASDARWREAWQRYYRMIFRDGFGRLRQAASDIQTALMPLARRKDAKNPEAALNGLLLSWAQGFEYKRDAGSDDSPDFTDVVSTMLGAGSDCDSRSLLLCILLEGMGVRTALFVSREYSHAVYGAALDVPGAKIAAGGADFLLCETTARGVRPGMVAQDMSDTAKWIPVLLP